MSLFEEVEWTLPENRGSRLGRVVNFSTQCRLETELLKYLALSIWHRNHGTVLFNSLFFICGFLPVVALIFFILGKINRMAACLWLCGASLFFYGNWNVQYVPLLMGSAVFNYFFAAAIAGFQSRPEKRPLAFRLLVLAVGSDLVLLGYYKYFGFFTKSIDDFTPLNWSIAHIVLPLGISFFTFTQIAFLVDTYRGKSKEYNFIHYLLFVTYFPHLIAGPILHHAQMMPQFALRKTYVPDWRNLSIGLSIFIIGLFKKVLLADSLSSIASPIFNITTNGASPMFFEAWIGALAYTLQLYFDFSGYTDMAIGASYLFNIRLPLNFNSPYKAVSIIDFWRRWHMTLSAFLRDYLYIPLGGNRRGPLRRYVNLGLTMLLGGLWHGASWTFVVWGGLHGIYLIVNHGFQAFRSKIGWGDQRFGYLGRICSIGVTFFFVVIAWVFFRSADFNTAQRMLLGMSGLNGVSLLNALPGSLSMAGPFLKAHGFVFDGLTPLTASAGVNTGMVFPRLAIGFLIIWGLPNTQEWMQIHVADQPSPLKTWEIILRWQPAYWWTWAFLGLIFGITLLSLTSGAPSEFLYFQF